MTHEIQTLMLEYYELWGRMDAVYDRWAKAHGMTYTELMVLCAVGNETADNAAGSVSGAAFAKTDGEFSSARPAKRQLVVFRESALDHRRKEILLTQAGKALAGDVIQELQAHEMQVIQREGLV